MIRTVVLIALFGAGHSDRSLGQRPAAQRRAGVTPVRLVAIKTERCSLEALVGRIRAIQLGDFGATRRVGVEWCAGVVYDFSAPFFLALEGLKPLRPP